MWSGDRSSLVHLSIPMSSLKTALRTAHAALASGQLDEALKGCKEALSIDRSSVDAYL